MHRHLPKIKLIIKKLELIDSRKERHSLKSLKGAEERKVQENPSVQPLSDYHSPER